MQLMGTDKRLLAVKDTSVFVTMCSQQVYVNRDDVA